MCVEAQDTCVGVGVLCEGSVPRVCGCVTGECVSVCVCACARAAGGEGVVNMCLCRVCVNE